MVKPPPMHPAILTGMGVSMLALGIGLMAFAAWARGRGGPALGIMVTALAVLAGGWALMNQGVRQRADRDRNA